MGAVNNTCTATILNTASLSQAMDIGSKRVLAIQTPAAIDGTAFTFEASADGTTWAPLYDDAGTEISVSMGASRYIPVDPANFASCRWLKVRTGTNAAPSAQSADRSITLISAPVLGQ